MDLEKVREQIDQIDIKAVKIRQGLDRLLSGKVAETDDVQLTKTQKTAIQEECVRMYGEIKESVAIVDSELSS